MPWRKPLSGNFMIGHIPVMGTIIGFWLFYTLLVSLRALFFNVPDQMEWAGRRAVVTIIGICITILLYLLLRLLDHKPLSTRFAAAIILSIPAAFAIAGANYYVFEIYDPVVLFDDPQIAQQIKTIEQQLGINMWQAVLGQATERFFFLVAWSLLYLALGYARDVREAERVASRFARVAQDAELTSLRYQVNPHFLFNTLNSLSSLVIKENNAQAERMIQNLATFYRASLSSDPLADVTLTEEVELQRRYLEIEAIRYPERLRALIEIAPDVANISVPALILQPLVENAIKHGVSRSSDPVTLSIIGWRDTAGVHITICDDAVQGATSSIPDQYSSIGLANVRDRLELRYAGKARLIAGPLTNRGFEATILLPDG